MTARLPSDSLSPIPALEFASELLPRIFEPFVTTKGETGTGLGLWVTEEIVRRNGWTIKVRSSQRPGKSGTVFVLCMPAARSR